MPAVDPHIEVITEWIRAGIRQQVALAELPRVFGPTFEEVAEAINTAGGDIIGPAYACYFGMPSDVVDVEIGFGISTLISSANLILTQVPSQEAAVGTHLGPYDELTDSYDKLLPWMQQQGIDLSDHMYEFYDAMDDDQSPPITRLVFPLA